MDKKENRYSMIFTTAAGKEQAKKIAMGLVEKHLAACVQMFPVESVYFWQEKICEENEILLLIKTKTELFDEVKKAIMEIHSYEVPEIIQAPITDGLAEYLKWIGNCTCREKV